MTVERTTQVVVESLSQADPKARTTQVVVETLSSNDPPAASPVQMIIVT